MAGAETESRNLRGDLICCDRAMSLWPAATAPHLLMRRVSGRPSCVTARRGPARIALNLAFAPHRTRWENSALRAPRLVHQALCAGRAQRVSYELR
ncbi:hypothetical protein D0B32_30730 [Paraburkholderia sp. DHOC27]|nr:hypothetical protein D0B32_30730 [Paraburkholderia sp. DHOC27]